MQNTKQDNPAHHQPLGYSPALCTAGSVEGVRRVGSAVLLPSDTAQTPVVTGYGVTAGSPSPADAGPTGRPGPADGALMRPAVSRRMPGLAC